MIISFMKIMKINYKFYNKNKSIHVHLWVKLMMNNIKTLIVMMSAVQAIMIKIKIIWSNK
jgi:hypothetical protein